MVMAAHHHLLEMTRCTPFQNQSSSGPLCKPLLRMTKSLTMNTRQSMARENSFHHDSQLNQPNMATVQENEDTIDKSETLTYRTSNDYYLDEDELILPLFPDEQSFLSKSVRLPKSPNKLEALDSMVISTTHNVSSKLCR